jgi:hypothetical protein
MVVVALITVPVVKLLLLVFLEVDGTLGHASTARTPSWYA